jgi:hypothetical protein
MPHRFPQAPLHKIPDHCASDLGRYRQPHAQTSVSRPEAGGKRTLGESKPRGLHREELRATQEPDRLGKSELAPRHGYFCAARTTSRLRPLARRRFRTLRPAGVALRLRNPCSLLRRTLLGWYVRFTATASNSEKARQSSTCKRSSQENLRIVDRPAEGLYTNHAARKANCWRRSSHFQPCS